MAQAFGRSSNSVFRVGLFAVLVGPLVVLMAGAAFNTSPYVTRADTPRDQPVPFSHQHHVGGLGIDCRYCHTSVEDSSYAGLPPTKTCMTCHSQIWTNAPLLLPVRESWQTGQPIVWNRVNDLPDFTYFNHSIHVHKGVGCVTCHGRVDQMALTHKAQAMFMSWCLDCHRSPERYVRPREQVFSMTWAPAEMGETQETLGRRLVREYHIRRLTDCYTCHR